MSEFIGKTVRLRNGKITGPIKERVTGGPYILTDGKTSWDTKGYAISVCKPDGYDIVEVVAFTPLYEPGVELTATPSLGRIYLAGPMAGYPDRNYPAFHNAARLLRSLGFEVYNPAEYEANERFKGKEDRSEFPLREAFTEYTNYILNRAEIIALLPGHERSVGASAELALARVVKLKEVHL